MQEIITEIDSESISAYRIKLSCMKWDFNQEEREVIGGINATRTSD